MLKRETINSLAGFNSSFKSKAMKSGISDINIQEAVDYVMNNLHKRHQYLVIEDIKNNKAEAILHLKKILDRWSKVKRESEQRRLI